MATWQNAFDLGACNVALYEASALLWSGAMTKGDTHSGTTGFGNAYTLAADATGVVSLSLDVAPAGAGRWFQVYVLPQYAHDFPARVTDFATYVDAGGGGADVRINATLPGADGVDRIAYGRYQPGQAGRTAITVEANSMPPAASVDMTALTGTRDGIGVTVAEGAV